MVFTSVVIKNLRALEDIEVTFTHGVNVIMGPNATGKTTFLEAIRLAKGLLAPRTQNEANQVLISMGIITPYNQQRLISAAIANDPTKQVLVKCSLVFSNDELAYLDNSIPSIARDQALATMGQSFAGSAAAITFFSTDHGMNLLTEAKKSLSEYIKSLRTLQHICQLGMTLDPSSGLISSSDETGAALVAALERNLPPHLTYFSYFPADRAIPNQEQPVQIGSADAAAVIESHNSQPQLKYQRLKNTIFNALLMSEDGRREISESFGRIFGGLLKGRQLAGVGTNEHGLLGIMIKDIDTGKVFNMDALSSGEKGLVLTFLLISRNLQKGGVVILDEPELHLSSAVCRNVLDFLITECAQKLDLQFIICSHSPEILTKAYEREDCSLFHLRSSKVMTPVRAQDQHEVNEALKRLGTTAIEDSMYRGIVFLEGPSDVDILSDGFDVLLRKFKLQAVSGRQEIEKQINALKAAEEQGAQFLTKYFVFDRDEQVVTIANSSKIRVLQWSRRCLENYLLDADILTNLLMTGRYTPSPITSVGEVTKELKELAFSQIPELAAKRVYSRLDYKSPGLRVEDVRSKPFLEIAERLYARIDSVKEQLGPITKQEWIEAFMTACKSESDTIEILWENKWREECDGKRLFLDFQRKIQINQSLEQFKRTVVTAMKHAKSENWQIMENSLRHLLQAEGA